jgi:hypothetical protein
VSYPEDLRTLVDAELDGLRFSNSAATAGIEEGETPYEVAIDEAVEIAKEYCGADAPKFINGVLGAIVREREPAG